MKKSDRATTPKSTRKTTPPPVDQPGAFTVRTANPAETPHGARSAPANPFATAPTRKGSNARQRGTQRASTASASPAAEATPDQTLPTPEGTAKDNLVRRSFQVDWTTGIRIRLAAAVLKTTHEKVFLHAVPFFLGTGAPVVHVPRMEGPPPVGVEPHTWVRVALPRETWDAIGVRCRTDKTDKCDLLDCALTPVLELAYELVGVSLGYASADRPPVGDQPAAAGEGTHPPSSCPDSSAQEGDRYEGEANIALPDRLATEVAR